MTDNCPEPIRPRVTITYRPARSRIFWTQFRAEATPRLQPLTIGLIVLGLLMFTAWLYPSYQYTEYEAYILFQRNTHSFLAGATALATLLFSTITLGLRDDFSSQPWKSMALPVRRSTAILACGAYHVLIAAMLTAAWGAIRYMLDFEQPLMVPALYLFPVALQGHAFAQWIAATERWRGIATFLFGLSLVVAVPLILADRYESESVLVLLSVLATLGGIVSAYLAGMASHENSTSTRPKSTTLQTRYTAGSIDVRLVPRWSIISRHSFPTFPSALWAQVWFEWRRSAMWLPLVAVVGLVASALLGKAPFGGIAAMGALFAVPVVIAYFHIRLSAPYRNFVLVRPLTSARLGRAKMIAIGFAIAATACITVSPKVFLGLLRGYIPDFSDLVANGVLMVTYGLLSVYGLVGIGCNLLAALITFPVYMVRMAIADAFDPHIGLDYETVSPTTAPIPGATVLAIVLAAYIFHRQFANRYDFRLPWPRELLILVAALLPPVVVGMFLLDDPVKYYAALWYTWVTPIIALAALLRYGMRMRLISRKDALAGLALFLPPFALAGYTYTHPTDITKYFLDEHFGHWSVAVAAAIVWYPLVVEVQRFGAKARGTADD